MSSCCPRLRCLASFRSALPLLALTLLVAAPGLVAQGPAGLPRAQLDLVSGTVDALITQADEFIEDGQAEEAIAIIERVQTRHAQELTADPAAARSGFSRYHPVSSRCQLWIASLSHRLPGALEIYREQVDPLAERWLREARVNHDRSLLERIIEFYPNSRHGDQAMLLLGEMCLEAEDFSGARDAWQSIHGFLRSPGGPAATGPRDISLWHSLRRVEPSDLPLTLDMLSSMPAEPLPRHFPGSDISPPEVLSRLVLVSILEGDIPRARWELKLLGQLFPQSEGTIAGQEGRYVDLLGGILLGSREWKPLPDTDWTTYAGIPSRQPIFSHPLDLRSTVTWSRSLQRQSANQDLLGRGHYRVAERADSLLSYHPVAWREYVFCHDGRQILAYRIEDGSPAWGSQEGVIYTVPVTDGNVEQEQEQERVVGVARQTITIDNGRLFARMGSSVTAHRREQDLLTVVPGLVVGLDLELEGKSLEGFPLRPPGDHWAFEGTPVSDGDSIYLLLRYRDEVRSQFHVACYSIQSGRQRWQQQVCAAAMPSGGRYQERSHHLLTLHKGKLFCSPGAGVVASISCRDGRIRWITSYPRSTLEIGNARETGRHFFRDLTPPLVDKSTLLCAPPDSDRLFALELSTGRLIWQTASGVAEDVKYLLGVVQGELVASGDRLYWFDVYNGKVREQYPRLGSQTVDQPRPDPAGWGRGLVAAGRVYWPQEDKIVVFEKGPGEVGWQHKQEINLAVRSVSGGNLVPWGNRLLIATPDQLHAFQNDR